MSRANMLAYSLGECRDNEVDFYITYYKTLLIFRNEN